MQSLLSKTLFGCALLGFAIVASAHTRIEEVWTCTINDGKSAEEVQAANLKWVRFVNSKIEGGDIHSYVATPIVGTQNMFVFVDSFPSMDSWTATKALMQTSEGKPLGAAIDEVATCSSNTLYSVAETE